ncbi:kinesin motor domain protein [Ceratobasidium sp. AG-Ba]|nr:kinesin motor domain protein [Ceratobasidium sp. AG-Ba]
MSLSTSQIEKNSVALSGLLKTWLNKNPEDLAADLSEPPTLGEKRGAPKQVVTVALRTRPFLANEAVDDKKPLAGVHARGTKMVVHVPAAKWSGPTIQHNSFEGDFSFGPESSSKHVYESLVVKPGLLDTVFGGGVGCILAYGQTGSGKTHTISSSEEIIARDIFPAKSYAEAHFPKSPKPAEEIYTFGLSLYELLGNKVSDLLDRDLAGNGANVDIVEDKLGEIRVSAKVLPFSDTKELESLIASATGHRRTSATLKNETSSRSSSKLTLALKPVFDVEATRNCKTVVVAHVSPHLADASHSNNTLTYISPFRVMIVAQPNDLVPSPSAWSNEEFRAWVSKTSTKIDPIKLAPFESGKQMCELDESIFIRRCMESEKDNIVGMEKALTEKGAKSFYDKLWELMFAAKQSTRPEIKLTYNPPSAWSNFQVRDYVEKELPAIDLDKFCPSVGEAEFIILAQSSAKDGETVSVEDAKGLHSKMWKLENDTWNAERKTILARRQDESTETGTGNTLQFLDTRLDDASIYAKGAAATLSLSYTDNSPEAIARREEYLKRDQAILEQWRREQAENGS